MIGLNAPSVLRATLAKEPTHDTTSSEAIGPKGTVKVKPAVDIHVDLSNTGRSLSAGNVQKNKNDDIDDSDLPDAIKQTLKLIREIKAQLQEKLQELQAAQANQQLTADQRKARVMAIQSEVSALSAALTAASGTLVKLMNDMPLSSDQKMTASMLSMA